MLLSFAALAVTGMMSKRKEGQSSPIELNGFLLYKEIPKIADTKNGCFTSHRFATSSLMAVFFWIAL